MDMNEFQKDMRIRLRALAKIAERAAKYCDWEEFEGCVLYEDICTIESEVCALVNEYIEEVPACDRDAIRRLRTVSQ